jgi:hypothetical protein
VISTVDPQTRHAHKTVHRRQDGFRARVAVEPDTGIVTDCALTKAAGAENQDAAVGVRLLEGEEPGLDVLGDCAYGTGEARAALEDAGHRAVIKPPPLRPAVPGGFTIDDFTVDRQVGTVHLPERCHPDDHQENPGGNLQCGLPRLPGAGPVHDQRDGPHRVPAQARPVAACRTPTSRHSGVSGRVPAVPAAGGTVDCATTDKEKQVTIILLLWWSLARGNHTVPSRWQATLVGPGSTCAG